MRAFSRLLIGVMFGVGLIAQATAADKLKVLLIDGQNNHKWAETSPVILDMLAKSGRFEVTRVTTPDKTAPAEAWDAFRPDFKQFGAVFVNYNDFGGGNQWPEPVRTALEAYMADGGGLVIFHAANNAFPKWEEWNKMIGLNWQGPGYGDRITIDDTTGQLVRTPKGQGPGAGHGPRWAYRVKIYDPEHPITKGMPRQWTHAEDELYHGQRGPALNMHVLAGAYSDPAQRGTGAVEPLVYTVAYGKGRVFVNLMGHAGEQTNQPDMIALLTRGTEWAATGQVTLPLPENFKGQ